MKQFVVIALILCGCASEHRRGDSRYTLERFDPSISGGLVSRQTWSDSERGGGTFLFTDPTVLNLVAVHTNQAAVGGGSYFTAGTVETHVDTNTGAIVSATGTAVGNVVGAAVKAAAK